MPIKVECEICGKKYRLADDRAGTTIPCKDCGGDIDVPGRALRTSGHRSSGRMASGRRVSEDSNAQLVKWIIVSAAAAIALLVAFVIVPRLLKDDVQQPNEVAKNENAVQDNSKRKSNKSSGNPAGGFDPDKQREESRRRAEEIRKRMQQQIADNSGSKKTGGFDTSPKTQKKQANSGGFDTGSAGNSGKNFFNSSGPANWSVKADPPAVPFVLETEKKIEIRVPSKRVGNSDEIVFPNCPSPFVAVGGISFGKANYEVWDLSTVKKVGEIKGSELGSGALSPDGKHFACRFGGKFGKPQSILTLDIQAGIPLTEILFNSDKTSAAYLEFGSSTSLVAIANTFGGNDTIRTWSVPSMEPIKSIELGERGNHKTAAMSPGGRYLAMMMGWDKSLNVYDLQEGKLAGKLDTAEFAKAGTCAGLAFSPNGEEIGGFFEGKFSNDSTLICWNASTGAVTVTHAIPKSEDAFDGAMFNKGRSIVWFADNNKWLILGRHVIDREAGGPVWSVPNDPTSKNRGERRVLDHQRVLAVTGAADSRVLGAFPFPEELLTAGAEALKSGAKVADIGLPPITKGDLSRVVQLDVSLSSAWKLKPEIDDSFKSELKADVSIDSKAHLVQGGLISSTKAGRAIVVKTKPANNRLPARVPARIRGKIKRGNKSNASNEKSGDSDPPVVLDVVDLVNAKVIQSIPINFETELLSMSSSGKFAVVRMKKGEDRLDVYNLESGEHVVAWRPYQDKPKHGVAKWSPQAIQSAVFLDDTHLLTVNNATPGQDKEREFIVWAIPSCEAIYALKGISQLAVSPDGKHIVIDLDKRLHFLDSTSGEKTGELRVDGKPTAIAFHPRGDQVAVVYGSSVQTWLEAWSLDGGESELRIPIPESGSALHWCGDNHLLLNNQRLIDLDSEMVVWSFSLASGLHIPMSPNGQHWYLIESPQSKSSVILKAVELPDPKLASILADVKPVRETVMEPGATVGLQFSVGSPPGKANFSKQLQDRWTSALSSSGINVGQNPNLRFVISSSESSTGKTQEYRTIGVGGSFKIAVKEIKVSIQLMQNNKPAWKFEQKFSNGSFFTSIKKGEPPQTALDRSMRNSASQFLETFVPPTYVFSEDAAKGVGESTLTVNGSEVAASN